ncbi:epoxide hydrolase family protein [Nonomuraea sp. MTCD27]|uniref:epoxide hydrolase family protein n=1 Tax=Nonomuraea sp. MTCD27 TaxID=1676747 RepID=UPI0035BEBB07
MGTRRPLPGTERRSHTDRTAWTRTVSAPAVSPSAAWHYGIEWSEITLATSLSRKPWQIPVNDEAVDDLRTRLGRVRWPDEINDAAWGWGVDGSYLRHVVEEWARFDWHRKAAELNEIPQFMADVEGHRLHFVHIVGAPETPGHARLPLLLLHGWPGSFVEMLSAVPSLTAAAASRGLVLDVVIPSLPGFGYSARPTAPGTSPEVTARLFHTLMEGLGHSRYAVQGGDIGAGVAMRMSLREPGAVIGVHLNFPSFRFEGGTEEPPDGPGPRYDARREAWAREEGGYSHMHATRPQTLGYALADSPVGMAAWIVEKFHAWTDRSATGGAVPVGLDEILTNLSVYWFSQTITSSMRMYKESAADPLVLSPRRRIEVPVGVAAFPYELPIQPRERVEQAANLVRWTDMPRGGHFAALEAPDLLAADVIAFFAGLPAAR